MNHSSVSGTIQQQQQTNQLLRCQTTIAKPEKLVCTTEKAITSPLEQLDTVVLVQYGGLPSAIILAIAFLILALAEYNKVFVPVMLQKRDIKTK
ncbi:hypothetical protein [Tolypothrix sp. VBCCA 56010]|uniref:hypothetical protein n=1 Tax=Tolypothrix sp. VBCCA 56010 TaxID=3137731 RepID=UPI003D7D6176